MADESQERIIPTEEILEAYRRAKHKISPMEAKKRGASIEEKVDTEFHDISFKISSLKKFFGVREDFPYKEDWEIGDGTHYIAHEAWKGAFNDFEEEKLGVCAEWKEKESWSAKDFAEQLGMEIGMLPPSRNSLYEPSLKLAIFVEMAFLLGIEKQVAVEVIKEYESLGAGWQQGLPSMEGGLPSGAGERKSFTR